MTCHKISQIRKPIAEPANRTAELSDEPLTQERLQQVQTEAE